MTFTPGKARRANLLTKQVKGLLMGQRAEMTSSLWLVGGGAGGDGEEVAVVLESSRRQQDVTSAQGKSLRGPRDTASRIRAHLCAQDGAGGKSPCLSNQRALTMAIPPRLSVASFHLIFH